MEIFKALCASLIIQYSIFNSNALHCAHATVCKIIIYFFVKKCGRLVEKVYLCPVFNRSQLYFKCENDYEKGRSLNGKD